MTFEAAIEEFKSVTRAEVPMDSDQALRHVSAGLIELTTALQAELAAMKKKLISIDG